jgi:hypothetical protein
MIGEVSEPPLRFAGERIPVEKREKKPYGNRNSMITEGLVLGLVVFSIFVILLILTKINRAVRLLNNRINLQSSMIKQLRKAQEGGDLEAEDPEALLKRILDKEFG